MESGKKIWNRKMVVLVQSGSGEVLSGRGLMEVIEWDENWKDMAGWGGGMDV